MAFDVWRAETVCLKLFPYFDGIGCIWVLPLNLGLGFEGWVGTRFGLTRICFEAAPGTSRRKDSEPSCSD